VSDKQEALARQIPDTPPGRRLAWWLGRIADNGDSADPADFDFYAPSLRAQEPLLGASIEALREAWRGQATRLGEPLTVAVERSSESELVAVVATSKGRRFVFTVATEPDPPHGLTSLRYERKHEFQLDVREATASDASVLADIERRCPIVMGDTSVWFDRGADYMTGPRLMEDCTIGLASVDGVPAAVSCGAERLVLVGGAVKKMVTVSHLRVLPEHQRKGLWGAANRVLEKYWDHVDGSQAYISVDNAGMQHGFEGTPDKWPQIVQRAELDCTALAGPMAGRPATRADADEIARRLTAFHRAEELFVPYDGAGLARRVERAPDLYGWDNIWMTDSAVVGVWAAGAALRTVTEIAGAQTVTMPGVVLDYAFAPAAEAEFEALLRAWCGRLASVGLDTLVIYTSPASTGHALIATLARSVGDFFTWTPGIPVPPGAERRGLYTDAIYF
jgi:hypothetical protein